MACRALFTDMDRVVEQAGVRDQGPVLVQGFPFLRVDRFLASFRGELETDEQFKAWVGYLARLDAEARTLEGRNLGPEALSPGTPGPAELDGCRDLMVQSLLADDGQRTRLLEAAYVPDDYVTAWRFAGLYPLTSRFVAMGVRRGQNESRRVFARPLESLPLKGRLQRWQGPHDDRSPAYAPALDPLGIPVLTRQQVGGLFRQHAPVWEVDVADGNDLIGTAVWRRGPALTTGKATEYQSLSYTRFGEDILVQLNYVIWFSARPGNDIYSGRFDGLVWRVTLGPDGTPWLYDSIHNCGCYHTFFPTRHLQLRNDLPDLDFEPPLVPQRAPASPLVLRVASGTHYLQRVYTDVAPGENGSQSQPPLPAVSLATTDYDHLRSLPAAEGYRSFFSEYALVDGSERGERFVLWPMGVRSPGAMRQLGHHPVAFVGRRHFDDAWLVESIFQSTDP
jgi:hypothetical protein